MAKTIEIVGGPHDGKLIPVPADQDELVILLAPLPEELIATYVNESDETINPIIPRQVRMRIDPLTYKAHWPKEPT